MGVTTGLNAIGTYPAYGTLASRLAVLLSLIPDPDAPHGTGAVGGGGNLDEMSPGAAAQIRVELAAMSAASVSASGQYTVVTADDTAGLINITTGLADFTLSKTAISIYRAGTELLTARTLSKQTGGVLRITDSTYLATAGDIVNWNVRL